MFAVFSAYTHGRKLFDITENKSPSSINCLNGLRAISVFWIMFGHRVLNQTSVPVANLAEFIEFYQTFPSVIISAYHLSVDTFFLMGALLVTQSLMRAFESGTFNYFRLIFRRYIRYTPVMAAIILYTVSLMKFTLTGPFSDDPAPACKKYWWTVLLYIHNAHKINQCLNYSWYLAADFQLFILTPFIVYPAFKYGWKYVWSVPVLGLLSSVYVLIFSLMNNLYVRPKAPGDIEMYLKWVYGPTFARLGPWMLGILLGFILHKFRNKKIEISKRLNTTFWIISLSSLMVVMSTTFPLSKIFDNETSLLFNALYMAFHRFVWASAVAWIIFACHKLKTGKKFSTPEDL